MWTRKKGLRKRGLSPLLATAILISLTLAGGALLYQYFSKALSTYTISESVELSVSIAFLDSGKALLYYSVTNRGDIPMLLSEIRFKPEGVISPIDLGNYTLLPAKKITGVKEVDYAPSANVYAILTYIVDNSKHETKPVKVSIS